VVDVSSSPAEVTKLDVVILVKEEILRLQISVKDIMLVKILDCQASLVEEMEDFIGSENFLLMEMSVKSSVLSIVKD